MICQAEYAKTRQSKTVILFSTKLSARDTCLHHIPFCSNSYLTYSIFIKLLIGVIINYG